jgi:hypothetical protein
MRYAALLFALLIWAVFLHVASARADVPPPPLALEAPECAVSQNGRVDCLARDRTGAFFWSFHDGRKWSRAQRMNGQFVGPASCVVRGPLGINCFAIRADGSLWHAAMNGGAWRGWRPLGGRLAFGRPSCLAPGRNQLACYARSVNGTLAIKAWLGDAVWQEWRDAGGSLAGDPSCVRLSLERVACFWRRPDGLFAGLLPAASGPSSALLTLPRQTGRPVCAAIDGARVVCRARLDSAKTIEWRGVAELGGAGVDGFAVRDTPSLSDPVCTSRSGRVYCAYLTPAREFAVIEANAQGWTAPVVLAATDVAQAGRCFAFDTTRMGCVILTKAGELRAVFREYMGGPGTGVSTLSARPLLAEKPVPPPAAVAAAAPVPAAAPVLTPKPAAPNPEPVPSVSVREPLGAWRVFEPRTGLHCQVTLFDAPAQPYRSLTRSADCNALTSLRGVDRWSQSDGGIFLRDRRGRVFFRFFEAGPTALRAKWRRNDFLMMARDLRAFASSAPAAPVPPLAATTPPVAALPTGHVGPWRVRGPGRQSCVIRLTIDADTAETRARPDGCRGRLAAADGWSIRRGALVLERDGTPIARFVEGRGVTWFGRFEGGRADVLRMTKQ